MTLFNSTLVFLLVALTVACIGLYFHLLQSQSLAAGRQALLAEELQKAQDALSEALEPWNDEEEDDEEDEDVLPEAPESWEHEEEEDVLSRPLEPWDNGEKEKTRIKHVKREEVKGDEVQNEEVNGEPEEEEDLSGIFNLAAQGMTPIQIARALELPVGEVEILIALGRGSITPRDPDGRPAARP